MFCGCATIIRGGGHERVTVASSPIGARITVDGKEAGITPSVVSLTRRHDHMVKIELDGYAPYAITLTSSTSGWIWGNIVFGGLVGLVIDVADGAAYKLSPTEVSAALASGHADVTVTKDGLYVLTTLHADPSWQKVAQLEVSRQ